MYSLSVCHLVGISTIIMAFFRDQSKKPVVTVGPSPSVVWDPYLVVGDDPFMDMVVEEVKKEVKKEEMEKEIIEAGDDDSDDDEKMKKTIEAPPPPPLGFPTFPCSVANCPNKPAWQCPAIACANHCDAAGCPRHDGPYAAWLRQQVRHMRAPRRRGRDVLKVY